ncbi:MAG: Spy/CpxP family protein refolding chaperone [Desulfonatronovibrionaceae bacterium]
MKSSRFFGMGLFLAVSLIIMVSPAMARGGGGFYSQESGNGNGYANCPAESQLSEEQKEQFYQLIEEYREKMSAARQEMAAARAELNALLDDADADSAEIQSLKDQLSALNQAMFDARLDHWVSLSREFGITPSGLKQARAGQGWKGHGRYEARGNCPRGSR